MPSSIRLADGGGLCLGVKPNGSKLWWYRYRFDGKERTLSIGEYPFVGLKEARGEHFTARKLLDAGTDPMVARRAESEAKQKEAEAQQREAEARQREVENSFANVACKWWEWWPVGKSPRHTDYVLQRLKADVFPAFGHKFIDDVTASDVRKLERWCDCIFTWRANSQNNLRNQARLKTPWDCDFCRVAKMKTSTREVLSQSVNS